MKTKKKLSKTEASNAKAWAKNWTAVLNADRPVGPKTAVTVSKVTNFEGSPLYDVRITTLDKDQVQSLVDHIKKDEFNFSTPF